MLTAAQCLAIRDEIQRREPPACPVYQGAGYTLEEIRFGEAMDFYKRAARRPFPGFAEVLAVLVAMGYRKTEEPDESRAVEALMDRRAVALRSTTRRDRCSVCGRAG